MDPINTLRLSPLWGERKPACGSLCLQLAEHVTLQERATQSVLWSFRWGGKTSKFVFEAYLKFRQVEKKQEFLPTLLSVYHEREKSLEAKHVGFQFKVQISLGAI